MQVSAWERDRVTSASLLDSGSSPTSTSPCQNMPGAAKFQHKPFRKPVTLTACSVTDGARFLCASTGPASPPDPALQNKSLLLSSRRGLLCTPCCPAPSHFGWDVHEPPSLLCSLLISGRLQFESSPFLCTC